MAPTLQFWTLLFFASRPGAHGAHPIRLAGLCSHKTMLSVLSQALCALSAHQWGISKTMWSLLCRAKELGWWKKDRWQHGLTWFLPIIWKDEPVVRKYLQKGPFCLLKSFWISHTLVQWVGLQRRNMTRQFFPTLYLRIYVCPDPCFNHPQCTTQKYIKGWFLDPFCFSFNSWLAHTLKTDYEKVIICRKMSVN